METPSPTTNAQQQQVTAVQDHGPPQTHEGHKKDNQRDTLRELASTNPINESMKTLPSYARPSAHSLSPPWLALIRKLVRRRLPTRTNDRSPRGEWPDDDHASRGLTIN
jgi:hypothetical protein